AAPHGLAPIPLDALTEIDVGHWEGLDWQSIRYLDAEGFRRFSEDPDRYGYPGGEKFPEVTRRVRHALEELLTIHAGEAILVVGHHDVNCAYLAGLLGLSTEQARQMTLDYCGISVVTRDGTETTVSTLNAAFHLQGVAA